MIQQPLPRNSFTAGELSPWLYGRTDVDVVSRGAACLENMLVSPFGGIERRNGLEWIDQAGSSEGLVRLMRFAFSSGDQYVLEIGKGYIRYFHQGRLVRSGDGQPYVTASPWTTDSMVANLRMQQLNDLIYFVCPEVYPYTLARYGALDWRLQRMQMKSQPLINVLDNKVKATISLSYGVKPDTAVCMKTDADVFTPKMAGTELVCVTDDPGERRVEAYSRQVDKVVFLNRPFVKGEVFGIESAGYVKIYRCVKDLPNPNVTHMPESYPEHFAPGLLAHENFMVNGNWSAETDGEWEGVWAIEKSYDQAPSAGSDGWVRVKTLIQKGEDRVKHVVNGEETTLVHLRVMLLEYKEGGDMGKFELISSSTEYRYWFKVGYVDDARTAWLVAGTDYFPPGFKYGSTYRWSFSAFGVYNGYPTAVEFHQGRLWFAGTPGQPQTVWASAVDDLDSFMPGTEPDSALSLTLAASQQNRICWIKSLRGLVMGTSEGEWIISSSDGTPIGASNASFERQSSTGSAMMDALDINHSIYFVQQGGGKVNEFAYTIEADGFVSQDAGLLAEHILDNGVADWCLQKSVSPRLWCVMNNGTVACLTANKSQNVMAWHRVVVPDGRFVSVATMQGPGDWKDEVWAIIARDTGNGEVYTVERMKDAGVYLDHYKIVRSANNSLSGLGHLKGQTVTVCRRSNPRERLRVQVREDGTASLPRVLSDGEEWIAGVPYRSTVTTMPLEVMDVMGRHKNQVRSKVLLKESYIEFEFSGCAELDDWQRFEPSRHTIGSPYSGYLSLTHFTGGDELPKLSIRYDGTGPLTILAIVPELAVVA